jgi:hypothetical protein
MIRRSKVSFFIRSKVLQYSNIFQEMECILDFWSPEKIGSNKSDQEIENLKKALKTYDLLIELVFTKLFRRSKLF